MSRLAFASRASFLSLMFGLSLPGFGQNSYSPQAGQFAVAGTLPGEQNFPDVSINEGGGYVVWQDNYTDGDGLGISAQRLNANLSGTLNTFRVNEQGAGDQENPKVALLRNGGAVFVWQGGRYGFQHIYARFLSADGTFSTGDLLVNSYTENQQINPAVAILSDGGVLVVWSSYGQDGSLQGVYGRRFSSTGESLGDEFRVNQTTLLNQRTPAVAPLSNGNLVVAWVSESYRGVILNKDASGRIFDSTAGAELYDVSIFARLFDSSGSALGTEFQVNIGTNVCANPNLSAGANGFAVAWSERVGSIVVDGNFQTNAWDVFARTFDLDGAATSPPAMVNGYTHGSQFVPKLAAIGSDYLAVWTSLDQDGDQEGVYGRFFQGNGNLAGEEFLVNTTTISKQLQPAVASDGTQRFLTVWSSFVGGQASFDLFAQRYASGQPLVAPPAPFVAALSQSRLSVTWPPMAGYDVDHYEIYADEASTPLLATNNLSLAFPSLPGTSHSFRLAYKLSDGRVSPISGSATGTAWGEDTNFDGLPDDWQQRYWGSNAANWPGPNVDSDGDGASNLQEFLAGTDPANPASVLRTSILSSSQGFRLSWNTQPGFIYQVQKSANINVWTDVDTPRFAVGGTDSIPVETNSEVSLYRVVRIR
jgi:hypothetical protein